MPGIASIGCLIFLVVVCFICDFVLGGFAANPIGMGAFLLAGMAVVFLPYCRSKKSLANFLAAVLVYAIFTASITSVPKVLTDGHVGSFQHAYWGIQAGMTQAEVEAVIRSNFPNVQPSSNWSPENGSYNLGNIDERFNAEIIWITMKSGRVVKVEYLPD